MKRWLSLFMALTLLFLCGVGNAAEKAPAPLTEDGASMTMNGRQHHLIVETTHQTDNILIFTFSFSNRQREVALKLPVTVKAGDVVNEQWCRRFQRDDCELSYRVSENVSYYAANLSIFEYDAFPEGSSFRITVDSISPDGRTYSGRFAGTVVDNANQKTRVLEDGQFQITLSDITLMNMQNWKAK